MIYCHLHTGVRVNVKVGNLDSKAPINGALKMGGTDVLRAGEQFDGE